MFVHSTESLLASACLTESPLDSGEVIFAPPVGVWLKLKRYVSAVTEPCLGLPTSLTPSNLATPSLMDAVTDPEVSDPPDPEVIATSTVPVAPVAG